MSPAAAELLPSRDSIASFCEKHGVKRLELFGSALGESFRSDSDVDLLVTFDPARVPGLLRLAAMERELSSMFQGRRIDLRTLGDLSPAFRSRVAEGALTLYE